MELEPVNISSLIMWGFTSLLTGVVAFSAYSIRSDFKEMTNSLHLLAQTVAILNERLSNFGARLENLEKSKDH